ncbi:MAG TPA: molecular chaperone DnaJ [Acidimicrobiales bacterium]
MTTDYYELLGVSKNASDEELRRAYRALARELHPDANGGDPASEARFKEVSTAYETLRDPERRRRYDMFGPEGARPGAGGPGDMFGGGIGDIFETFFGNPFGSQRQNGPRRGDDVEVVVELAFEEAVFGVERTVDFRGLATCVTCTGTGAAPGTSPITCLECAGTGQVRRVRQSILGQVVQAMPCQRCRGIGELIESPCPTCHGDGRTVVDRSVTVEVPAGVDNGTTLRITSQGAPALRGGVAGDLYVHLKVNAHDRFERSGVDLLTTVHLSVAQAALGTDVEIETLDSSEQMNVPPGTQTGREVRLRGQGVPHVRGRGRGDLHVRFVVDTPTNLTKGQEDLLKQFAASRGEEIVQHGGLFSRIRSSRS